MIHFRVDFEIADNRANDLVVGAISPVENLKLPLEDDKQLLNIAMFLGQALNDHGGAFTVYHRRLSRRGIRLLRQIKSEQEYGVGEYAISAH